MYPGLSHPHFNISKLIGHVSKTLNFANQVLPLVSKVQPAIESAKNILGSTQKYLAPKNKPVPLSKSDKKEETVSVSSSNRPIFFV